MADHIVPSGAVNEGIDMTESSGSAEISLNEEAHRIRSMQANLNENEYKRKNDDMYGNSEKKRRLTDEENERKTTQNVTIESKATLRNEQIEVQYPSTAYLPVGLSSWLQLNDLTNDMKARNNNDRTDEFDDDKGKERSVSGGSLYSKCEESAKGEFNDTSDLSGMAISGKPVEIAQGVVRMPPVERNIHSTVLVSKATFETTPLPPVEYQQQLQDSSKGIACEDNICHSYSSPQVEHRSGKKMYKRNNLPSGTLADRPPIPLIQQRLRQQEEDLKLVEGQRVAPEEYILPSCSAVWFRYRKISQIEKDILPTLFCGAALSPSDMEVSYLNLRQQIVAAYRANPSRYLLFSDCRRYIVCDAALLLRTYSFLDYWGIINFQADPATLPTSIKRRKEFMLKDFKQAAARVSKGKSQIIGDQNGMRSTPAYGSGPWRCAACGKICLYSYYVIRPGGAAGVSLGVLDKCVWCLRCFAQGKYPHVLTESQFLKVELPVADNDDDNNSWKFDETERLIEGIEMHKEDWHAVATHVGGGKTPQQCVERFISLPIQEPFIESMNTSKSAEDNVPFLSFANPLLSLLAFLASVVHPSVASAAAKSALDKAVSLAGNGESGSKLSEHQKSCEDSSSLSRESVQIQDIKDICSKGNSNKPSKRLSLKKDYVVGVSDGYAKNDGLLSNVDLQVTCSTALAAGATSAEELAAIEELEVKKLMTQLVDQQLQRLDFKIKRFHHIENFIVASKKKLESKFTHLLREHSELAKDLIKAKQVTKSSGAFHY